MSDNKIRNVILIVVLALIIGGGSYLWLRQEQSEYTGPVEKITVAAAEYLTGVLVYVAEEQGYFKRNGLDVTIIGYGSGKACADALIDGEADISTSADNVLVSNSFEHAELRVLGTVATVEVIELVARKDKGITTPTDLKGKKIGVTKKSSAESDLGKFLLYNGLSIDDVELVDLKPSGIVKAVINGDVDAGVTWDPNVYDIKEELGDNAVSRSVVESFYFVLITKEDWIKNNPAAAERFIKSVLEAEDYIKDNSEDAKEFVKDRFDYDSAYIDYSWPNQEFAVYLEQAMLILFEDQARWKIKQGLTDATEVPDYLYYIYMDALEKVKPEAIRIIR